MNEKLSNKIQRWSLEESVGDDDDYSVIDQKIEFMRGLYFKDYEPCYGPNKKFNERLVEWIGNVNDENLQKLLFRLIPNIFFIGRMEFKCMYRSAFNGPIARWLVDVNKLNISDDKFMDKVNDAISRVWFCPITDSMEIASFCHVNRVSGVDHRPDWRSLRKFGCIDKINYYMERHNLNSVVMLEDFVGSGSQAEKAVEFCSKLDGNINVLLIPLVVCPAGNDRFNELAITLKNVSYEPVLLLDEQWFVKPAPNVNPVFDHTYHLAFDTWDAVKGKNWSSGKPYHFLGFRQTGSVVVMFSNTPDNTLPLIHHKSETWKPLFPRSTRI